LGIIFALSLLPFVYYWTLFSAIIAASPYALFKLSKGNARNVVVAYSWLVIFDIVLGIISYYGSLGTDYIAFPADYIIFAVLSGIIYVFATKIGYTTEKVVLFKEAKDSLAE
jgi:hypothetical protein